MLRAASPPYQASTMAVVLAEQAGEAAPELLHMLNHRLDEVRAADLQVRRCSASLRSVAPN